jgi:hypothetical protein
VAEISAVFFAGFLRSTSRRSPGKPSSGAAAFGFGASRSKIEGLPPVDPL